MTTETIVPYDQIPCAVPMLGLRVMIAPDKERYYDSKLRGKSGTIVSLDGDKEDAETVIKRVKQGRPPGEWWVKVLFDGIEGNQGIQVKNMLVLNSDESVVYRMHFSGIGWRTSFTKKERNEHITNYLIKKGYRLQRDEIINEEYRRKIYDEI